MEQSRNDMDYNYCNTVGQTDVGRKRQANEDNGAHFTTCNGLVAVVCDGMGGHAGGAVASETAIAAIREFLDGQYIDDPREAIGLAIEAANRAVLNRAEAEPALRGMGSTCVLLIVRDGKVYMGHVGDSRIYLIRERKILQLTKDHSFVQMLVDAGELTPEQAERHPRKNEITNALGVPNMSPATVKFDPVEPQAGDCFLLCSDGLSGMVSDREIERIVSKQRELRSQERADLLIRTANEHGGVDNITVELVEFTVSPKSVSGKGRRPILKYIIAASIALAVIAGGAIAYYFRSEAKTTQRIVMDEFVYKADAPVIAVIVDAENKKTNIEFIGTDRQPIVLETETDLETLESNLAIDRKTPFNAELAFGKEPPSDSVYLRIEGNSVVYHLLAKVLQADAPRTDAPQVDTVRMNTVDYEKPGERIATLSLDAQSITLLFPGKGSNSKVIIPVQADPYSVVVTPRETAKSSGLVWTIAAPKSNAVDRITISFKVEDKTHVFLIPVRQIAPVEPAVVPENPPASTPPSKPSEVPSVDSVRKSAVVAPAKKGSVLFTLKLQKGRYRMFAAGKTVLSFEIDEIDETSVSISPKVVTGRYDDGSFSFLCDTDLTKGQRFQVSFRGKDKDGHQRHVAIDIEIKQ